MIGHITGTVHSSTDQSVIIDVHGMGYLVYATATTLSQCLLDTSVSLHTHLVVREQALDLYGFSSNSEKTWFEMLINISGIGPRVAIAILNATTTETLVQAVLSKDSSVLTKISGIGKKNAEKIILELENKVDQSMQTSTHNTTNDLDVFDALEALGYKSRDIQETMQDDSVQSLETSQDKIKQAIRLLSR